MNGSLDIEGFTLLDGVVFIAMTSGNLTLTLRHLDITTTTIPVNSYGGIHVFNNANGQLNYEISGNRSSLNTGSYITGIFVDAGALAGSIHDNRISANAAAVDSGISVRTSTASSSALIYANQISGNIAAVSN